MPKNNSDDTLNKIYDRLSDKFISSNDTGRHTPLKEFTRLVRLLTNTHTCILTFVDLPENQVLRIASSSQDQTFEEYLDKKRVIHLNPAENLKIGVSFKIASKGREYETDSLQTDGGGVSNIEVAKRFNLNYFYCYPIKLDGNLKGYLNFFSTERKRFSNKLRLQIKIIAKFAEVPIRQYEIGKDHNLTLKEAIEAMAAIGAKNRRDQILDIALSSAIKLLNKEELFSSVLKLDEKTGRLIEVKAIPSAKENVGSIPFGKGFCSQALIEETGLIKNIHSEDWAEKFVDAWGRETKTEMIIPLLIKNEQIRTRNNVVFASRPIGVLNFESSNLNEFNQEDIDILLPLTSQASLLIEKLTIERKLSQLREIEKQCLTMQNLKDVLKKIAEGVRDVLGFEVVNISLVDDSKKTISTELIIGIEEGKVERFIELANHSLSSDDIQASIVKSKKIEVPDENDKRYDQKIREEFRHDDLIRVFVPVVSSISNKCVGTIEAGYRKGFRKYIYESDVQILKGFGELISEALEKQSTRIMDKISHELRSPVSGILGNIDRLKAHHRHWDDRFIDVKLEDIELDCEILKHNILELEYFLGRPFPKVKIEDRPIYVMKDIVLKTIKQLKPVIENEGFYFDIESCINKDDLDKIYIYTDKIKLGQVFYNLLVNSIRYAKRNFKVFRLNVSVDDASNKEFFIIKFQDWGIGIREEFRDRVFDEYFRSPEAKAQFVSGTGLGLTISRAIMRNDIKGDLVLAKLYNPTEFNVMIPKRYERKPL